MRIYCHIFIPPVLISFTLSFHYCYWCRTSPFVDVPSSPCRPSSSPHSFIYSLPAPERSRKKQKFDGDEGKIAFNRLLIALTANPAPSGLWTLWEQTWNRKEDAIPWFSVRKTERDTTSPVDVPEYCWVFSPSKDVASALRLDPRTILFRDDYLRVFSQLFASSGLGIFTPNLDRTPGATFPNIFSGAQVPQDTPKNAFILTGNPGIGT